MEHLGPSVKLSEIVEQYCMATHGDQRKYFLNYAIHARWVWKRLFRESLWSGVSKPVRVNKTTDPYHIVLPEDMERFINVLVPDECGLQKALSFDNTINTITALPVDASCCPDCGGKNELARCVNEFKLTTKEVIIEGVSYTEQVWKEVCANGDVIEIRKVPVQDFIDEGSYTIKTVTLTKVIANLKTNPCGCVADTEDNRRKIVGECGCELLPLCEPPTIKTLKAPYQKFGAIKLKDKRLWLRGRVPDNVILVYQTTGECDTEEISVPEYAVDALMMGIKWRVAAFGRNVSRLEIRDLKALFNEEVYNMEVHLHPLRMEEFMNQQMSLPKWGWAGTGLHDIEVCLK